MEDEEQVERFMEEFQHVIDFDDEEREEVPEEKYRKAYQIVKKHAYDEPRSLTLKQRKGIMNAAKLLQEDFRLDVGDNPGMALMNMSIGGPVMHQYVPTMLELLAKKMNIGVGKAPGNVGVTDIQVEEISDPTEMTQNTGGGEERKEGPSDEELARAYQTLKDYQAQGGSDPLTAAQIQAAKILNDEYLKSETSQSYETLIHMNAGKVPSPLQLENMLADLAKLVPPTAHAPVAAPKTATVGISKKLFTDVPIPRLSLQQWRRIVEEATKILNWRRQYTNIGNGDSFDVQQVKRKELTDEILNAIMASTISTTLKDYVLQLSERSKTMEMDRYFNTLLSVYSRSFKPNRLQIFRRVMQILQKYLINKANNKDLMDVGTVLQWDNVIESIGLLGIESTKEYRLLLNQIIKGAAQGADLKGAVKRLVQLIEESRPKTTPAQEQVNIKTMDYSGYRPIKGALKPRAPMTDEEYERALQTSPPTSPTERVPSRVNFPADVTVTDVYLGEEEQKFKTDPRRRGEEFYDPKIHSVVGTVQDPGFSVIPDSRRRRSVAIMPRESTKDTRGQPRQFQRRARK